MRKVSQKIKSKEKERFFNYQLSASQSIIKLFIVIIALFNLCLLIPDIINLKDPDAQMITIICRTVFVLMAAVLFIYIKKIKSFKMLSLIITVYELTAVFIFLHVFQLYTSPDFLIQLMGVFILIIAVFLIPNLWGNMVLVAAVIFVGFIICSYYTIENLDRTQLIASIVYLLVEIVLCAVHARFLNRYQHGEFIAKIELQRIYATDPLTQVGNRIKLEDEAKRWIAFCDRHQMPLSLVLVDVDDMKLINDRYGHLIGDVILYEIAQIMYTQLRKNDVCTRWGGDEFVLLLPKTDVSQARILTERIRRKILVHEFNIDIDITCSCGIAGIKKGYDLGQLIKQADVAMYMAKKAGKNSIVINEDKQT